MRVHKQRPGRPDAGARPQPFPPQSQGNGSDVGRAIPDDIGRIRAPKSTPGCPQPTRERHTTPLQPPKPLTSFKTLNIAPFGLASPQDLASTPSNIPNESHCAQDAFPMQATSAEPQQTRLRRRASESDRSVRNRSADRWS